MATTEIYGIDIHDVMTELKQAIEDRSLVINSASTIRALAKVRLGPDGRVDPASVNSEVRATARAYIAGRQTRELEAQKAKTKESRIGDLLDG